MTSFSKTSTVFLVIFSLFILGCDFGGSHSPDMETAQLSLTIKNTGSSSPETNATVERDVERTLQAGDELNVFVSGGPEDVSESSSEVVVPEEGEEREVVFTVPATQDGSGYVVELVGYTGDGSSIQNSVILGARSNEVEVDPGSVTVVDFTSGDSPQEDAFERFNFGFEFEGSLTTGGETNLVQVDISSDESSFIDDNSPGILGVDPDDIQNGDPSSALRSSEFSKVSSGLETEIKLPVGPFGQDNDDGQVSIMTRFNVVDDYEASGQDLYIYNNLDGSAQDGVELEGDGGIVIIF